MRNIIVTLVLTAISLPMAAQESMDAIMEKRARELHRVVNLNDKEQWKKFIREKYSEVLINKSMRKQVQTSDENLTSSSTEEAKGADPVEAKAGLFRQLYDDLGTSKIISIKPSGNTLEMKLRGSTGFQATFSFTFEDKAPYLISGIGIEAGDGG